MVAELYGADGAGAPAPEADEPAPGADKPAPGADKPAPGRALEVTPGGADGPALEADEPAIARQRLLNLASVRCHFMAAERLPRMSLGNCDASKTCPAAMAQSITNKPTSRMLSMISLSPGGGTSPRGSVCSGVWMVTKYLGYRESWWSNQSSLL